MVAVLLLLASAGLILGHSFVEEFLEFFIDGLSLSAFFVDLVLLVLQLVFVFFLELIDSFVHRCLKVFEPHGCYVNEY